MYKQLSYISHDIFDFTQSKKNPYTTKPLLNRNLHNFTDDRKVIVNVCRNNRKGD